MSDGLGDDASKTPNSTRIGKVEPERDAVTVNAESTGDITTGSEFQQTAENRPKFNTENNPTLKTEYKPIFYTENTHTFPNESKPTINNQNQNTTVINSGSAATAIVLVILVLILGLAAWLLFSGAGTNGLSSSEDSAPEETHRQFEREPSPPELPPLSMLPAVAGKTWVAAVKGPDYSWDGPSSRTLLQQLRTKNPSRSFSLVPSAVRPRLEPLMTADPEVAPGDGRAPEGTESLYALLMDIKDLNLSGPTEAVGLSCEASVVSFRDPEVIFQSSSNHTGQGPTSSGALDMALKRCLADIEYPD
ncbi:MAG: hypothetical protein AAFY88_13580 [Acidobacteriota bacterium]